MTTMVVSLLALVVVAFIVIKNVYPYSRIEIGLLHVMYSAGSGFDDGAADIIIRNQQRYAPQIKRMLEASGPGSSSERIALDFVEFVIDQPGIRESLHNMGEAHPDPGTKRLVAAILDGPPRTITIFEQDGVSVEMLVPDDNEE